MKHFTLFLLLAFSLPVLAQNLHLERTYVISGGVYSNPEDHVAVGYFEPASTEYIVFDSIYTQSSQDAITAGDMLFVCAGDSLVSYNLQTHERVAATSHTGLNKMAISGNKLVVSRQYPVTTESVLILDKQTLETSSVLSLSGEAAGIHVEGDSAYIAVPGAWGTEEGHLAIVDMNNETLTHEINLGADAKGTKEVFYRNSSLYIVNTHFSDYESNMFSITEYNIYSGVFETTIIEGDYYGYYGNSVLAESSMFIPVSAGIARYDIFSQEIQMGFMDESPAALAYDVSLNQLHITRSDYASYGEYQRFSLEGDPVSEPLECGISPEAMCLSYEVTNEFTLDEVQFWVGEGSNEALLVIDWKDEITPESMAWGYRFESPVDAETMLLEVAEADAYLEVETAGGFLNDITYNGTSISHSGLAGMPDYWSTWNRTAETLWEMNMGIAMELSDGARFGCSYGFNPEPVAPDVPAAAPLAPTNAGGLTEAAARIWIMSEILNIRTEDDIQKVEIFNASGQQVAAVHGIYEKSCTIPLRSDASGLLIVRIHSDAGIVTKKLIL